MEQLITAEGKNSVVFLHDMESIINKLRDNMIETIGFPNITWASKGFSSHSAKFIYMMCYLERLYFDIDETFPTYNKIFYKDTTNAYMHIKQDSKPGFYIIYAPRTQYEEIEGSQHLIGAENTLKNEEESHQFLKICTYNNKFIVYTNKPLPFETIIKLKILQLTLLENIVTNKCPEIIEILKTILDFNKDKLNELFNTLFEKDEIKNYKLEKLKSLFKSRRSIRIRRLKQELQDQEHTFLSYQNTLCEIGAKIDNLLDQINALENMKNEDNSNFIKYLTKHPYLKNISQYSENKVRLYFESPIIFYDKNIIEHNIHNFEGESKRILQAFLDNHYELMTRCSIIFNVETFRVDLEIIGSNGYFGHPHIDRYGCFGSHTMNVEDSARTGNLEGAIESISAATLNINFNDGVVVNTMLSELTSNRNRYLPTWRHKETKVCITTEELLKEYPDEEA